MIRQRPIQILVGLLTLTYLSSMALAQRKYPVSIQSKPSKATIYFDVGDKGYVKKTPYKGRLPAGKYSIVFELEGYEDTVRTFTVKKRRRRQKFIATFSDGRDAFLRMRVKESGVKSFKIDEVELELTGEPYKVKAGDRCIEVVLNDGREFADCVTLSPGQTKKVVARFKKPKKVVTTVDSDPVDDGDDPLALSNSQTREEERPRTGTRGPFIVAGLAIESGGRHFRFKSAVGNLRPYDAFGLPLGLIDVELFPLAFMKTKLLRHLALTGSARYAFPFSSSTGNGGSIDTNWFGFDVGLRAPVFVGDSLMFSVDVAYNAEKFDFDDGDNNAQIGIGAEVPGVNYRSVRLGLDTRFLISSTLTLMFDAGFNFVTQVGPVEDILGPDTAFGISSQLGVGWQLMRLLELRLTARYSYYGLTFDQGNGGGAQQADGGTDQLFGISLGAFTSF